MTTSYVDRVVAFAHIKGERSGRRCAKALGWADGQARDQPEQRVGCYMEGGGSEPLPSIIFVGASLLLR